MYELYDCYTDTVVSWPTVKCLAAEIKITTDSFYRLRLKEGYSLKARYTMTKEDCDILVDIDSGEEFILASNKTFFHLLKAPYSETITKYIYEVIKERQYCFSFLGRVFYKKGRLPRIVNRIQSESPWVQKAFAAQKLKSKIVKAARMRITNLLKIKNIEKRQSTYEFIGCSPNFLMEWLEKQFQEGMTWDNFGQEHTNKVKSWQIDHIRPCFTFDLSDIGQQNECFHYTNLRPLWEEENRKRGKGVTPY